MRNGATCHPSRNVAEGCRVVTLDELAAHDAADRRRIVEAALRDEMRGLALRSAQGGRTDAIEANVARLRAALETATKDARVKSCGTA